MRGSLWRALLGALALALATAGVVAGQGSGLPSTGWYTTATIQNLSETNPAEVTLAVFDAASTSQAALSATTVITPGANVVFRPDNPGITGTVGIDGIGNNFLGSMVVSSLEPLAAIAKVTNQPLASLGVPQGAAVAEYRGAGDGSTTLIYPSAKNKFNGQTTTFFIQAVGGDGVFTATVRTARSSDGTVASATYSKAYSVAANRSTVVIVSDLTNSAGQSWTSSIPQAGCSGPFDTPGGAPCFGALTIESSTPIAGAAVAADITAIPTKRANSSALLTPADGATQIYCPLYKSQFPGGQSGRNFSGVQVQNVSTGPVSVSVTILGSPNPPFNPAITATSSVNFSNVEAGASVVVSRFAGDGNFPNGGLGAVRIDASGPVIAATNEDSNFQNQPTTATYNCFRADDATARIAFPAAKRDFPTATSDLANNSGVTVQNIATDRTASVTAEYVCRNGVTATITFPLPPGTANTLFQNNTVSQGLIPPNSLCGVTVTARDSGNPADEVPVVGIVNEDVSGLQLVGGGGTVTFRDASNYEGLNQ
jgi:hypothetical protein